MFAQDNEFNNDFLKELESFITEEEAKDLGIDPEEESLKIHSPSQADFFLRLLNQAEAEANYVNTMCDNKIELHNERVNRFRDEKMRGLSSQIKYYTMLLETYATDALAGSKKKSMKLPEGTIGIKKVADKVEYDEEVVIDFLKTSHPELLREKVKVEINKAELKKLADPKDGAYILDGVEVEGVTVIPQPDKFYVKSTQ